MKLIHDEVSENWVVHIGARADEDFLIAHFEWWPGNPRSISLHEAMNDTLREWLRANARLDWTGNYLPMYSLRWVDPDWEVNQWEGHVELHFYRREIALLFMLTFQGADYDQS